MSRLAALARLLDDPGFSRGEVIEAASQLGFATRSARLAEPDSPPRETPPPDVAPQPPPPTSARGATGRHARPDPTVWRVSAIEHFALDDAGRNVPQASALLDRDPGDLRALPSTEPFATWQALWPRLRRLSADRVTARQVDDGRAVHAICRGRPLTRIPRKTRLRWPDRLLVWADADWASVPLWRDRDLLARALQRVCGRVRFGPPSMLTPGETLLRLGPLDRAAPIAERVKALGGRAAALTLDGCRVRGWHVARWTRPATRGTADARADRLRVMLSPIGWIQPGLLRDVRMLLPAEDADIQTELAVWQGLGVAAAQVDGFVFEAEFAARLKARFAALPPALCERIRAVVARWHQSAPEELRHVDALNWASARPESDAPFDVERARAFIVGVADAVRGGRSPELWSYARTASLSLLSVARLDPELARAISRLWFAGHRGRPAQLPRGIDPREAHVVADPDDRRSVDLYLTSRGLTTSGRLRIASVTATADDWLVTVNERPPRACPMDAPIDLSEAWRVRIDTGATVIDLSASAPPFWAQAVGRDATGLWADADVGQVVRFRWTVGPQGRWVGPAGFGVDRYGIFEDVVLAETETVRFRFIGAASLPRLDDEADAVEPAFWLTEEPVTDRLWGAMDGVGGTDGYRMVRAERATAFVDALNERQDGLNLSVPTRAQHQQAYACFGERTSWLEARAVFHEWSADGDHLLVLRQRYRMEDRDKEHLKIWELKSSSVEEPPVLIVRAGLRLARAVAR